MNHIIAISFAVISVATMSCKTPRQTGESSVKDIGVVNTADARTLVLYEDQDKVYLKVCKPPLAPPLTRDCPSDETPKFLSLDNYLYKLPFNVGPYQRDQQGLSLVTKALQDARNAVAGGNQNALPTVERLEPIRLNLEKLLSVSNDLKAQQQDLTYYEYQDEFSKLLIPFGDSGGGGGGGSTPIGMKFVKVPKGTFLMGSHSSESDRSSNEVQHRVTFAYDFFVQTTEVTQEQWFKVMGDNPSKFIAEQDCPGEYKQISGVGLCPNNPVEQVSWHDVGLFLTKMNEKRDGFYRLPTEAEWEYAARGGSTGPYSVAGNIADFAWVSGNAGNRTHAVAKLKPNAYGLYDVHGNVWEWTSDWYGDYPNTNVTDPVGASSGYYRVARGGGWSGTAQNCRSADRTLCRPDIRHSNLGFRLLRMPSP